MTEQPTTAAGRAAVRLNIAYVRKAYPVEVAAIEAVARQQDGSALRDHRCDYRCSLPGDHAGPHLFPTHTMPALPPSAPPALDVEQAYFDGYKSGMANEVDDWNKPDETLREFAAEYARLQEQDR